MLRSSVAPPNVTVKLLADVAVPPAVVTVILPVVEPLATVPVIWVELLTVKAEAAVELNFTAVAPVKLVPVMMTAVPTGPVVGLNAEIVGGGALIAKLVADRTVPAGVVTLILPVVVPLATVAAICVELFTVKLAAAVELNFTAVAPVKFVPVIVTEIPATPLVGLKLVMVGASSTVKFVADPAVPPGVITVIFPLAVPAATVAVIWVALSTEKLAAALPLNVTAVAPVRFAPVITTTAPDTPDAGAKLEIAGVAGGGGVLFEAADPQPAIARASVAQSSAAANHRSRSAVPCNSLLTKGK
jgi:hypothetical protein